MPSEESVKELSRLAEIGKFSGGILHDLTNHITTLSLSMNHLERCCLEDSEKLREYAKQSALARKNVRTFVDAIRKHIKGKDIYCYFSPEKKLAEIFELFSYRATSLGISIIIQSAGGKKNTRIYGSRLHFSQIFSNLISNSIDALSEENHKDRDNESKKIKIKLSRTRNNILIYVEDNGPGIPKSIKNKIFEPFFTTKSTHGGVGLGLPVIKEIVEKNFRGKISLDNRPQTKFRGVNQGAKFKIVFPSTKI